MKSKYDMKNTTLCYVEKDGKYLMLHRIKKDGDINRDKWIGLGGKFESEETPYECAKREILEEAGISPLNLKYRGIVTFVSDKYGTEYLHLFTANGYVGEVNYGCPEGVLEWIDKKEVLNLPIWEGDKIFLKLLLDEHKDFFSIKLKYYGEKLIQFIVE